MQHRHHFDHCVLALLTFAVRLGNFTSLLGNAHDKFMSEMHSERSPVELHHLITKRWARSMTLRSLHAEVSFSIDEAIYKGTSQLVDVLVAW